MQKYDSYKDTGIDWIGEIPVNWNTVSLKWISKIYSGGTPSKNKPAYWTNGTIPWLNSGTVNQWNISKASEYITEEALENSSAKWIKEKAILIALAGQGKTKGMVGQLQFKATCNQSLGVIDPFSADVKRYLLYWLHSNYQNIRNLGGGDKRDGINLEMIGSIPIPIPLKPQQTQIANYLDRKTTEIDQLLADKKALVKLYQEEKTAIINQAVTKGVNPYVKLKDSGIEWLGDIPKHWVSRKMKYECEKIGDGIHTTPKYTIDSEYKFINGNNLDNGSIKYFDTTKSVSESEFLKHKKDIKQGSILISINGTIGKLAFYNNEEVIFGKSAAYIQLKDSIYNKFIYFLFQAHYIKTQINLSFSGSTINNLSLYTLNNLAISIPKNKSEQIEIVQRIEKETKMMDAKIAKAEQYINLLTEYRTALISEVVTGKIKVID